MVKFDGGVWVQVLTMVGTWSYPLVQYTTTAEMERRGGPKRPTNYEKFLSKFGLTDSFNFSWSYPGLTSLIINFEIRLVKKVLFCNKNWVR